jgi:hypothetical protein
MSPAAPERIAAALSAQRPFRAEYGSVPETGVIFTG